MSIDPSPSDAPRREASTSRRGFLAAGAAASAALLAAKGLASDPNSDKKSPVVSSPAAATKKGRARRPVADDENIRIGMIGIGGMGGGHMNAILNARNEGRATVDIVALAEVCDRRLAGAKSRCTSAQEGVEVAAYRDYREMLERDDIHAVFVATPEHWHAQQSIDAIHAGMDVYCEKPMTLDLPDALRLHAVANAHPDIILQVGTQMTRLPRYAAARKAIADGMIGTPVWSQTSYCRNSKDGEWLYYPIDPAWKPGENLDWNAWCGPLGPDTWDPEVYARWRRYKKWSTGIIGDLLVHTMTPMMYAANQGWPTRVVAAGGHLVDKAMENFDQVNLTVEFETGHQMIVAGSTANEVGLETMIRGHEGTLYLGGRHCVFRPERLYADEREEERIECEDIGNDQEQHRLHFFKFIRTRERPESDVEQGTKVMVVVDLATRSMWEGSAFRFDPGTMSAYRA